MTNTRQRYFGQEGIEDHNRRLKLIEQGISDCSSVVGMNAIEAQRKAGDAFQSNKITLEELYNLERRLDQLMYDFSGKCYCKKGFGSTQIL